jgi:hypothetical protein
VALASKRPSIPGTLIAVVTEVTVFHATYIHTLMLFHQLVGKTITFVTEYHQHHHGSGVWLSQLSNDASPQIGRV